MLPHGSLLEHALPLVCASLSVWAPLSVCVIVLVAVLEFRRSGVVANACETAC
jgi:hypothetical protein